MLEGDLSSEILPWNYIHHFQCSEGNKNIDAARKVHDKIIHWVQHDVLHSSEKKRCDVLESFVYAAEVVLNRFNFHILV